MTVRKSRRNNGDRISELRSRARYCRVQIAVTEDLRTLAEFAGIDPDAIIRGLNEELSQIEK